MHTNDDDNDPWRNTSKVFALMFAGLFFIGVISEVAYKGIYKPGAMDLIPLIAAMLIWHIDWRIK